LFGVTIDPRTPVLVGQAQVAQHEETITNARGPIELMAQAISDAAIDAGIAKLGNASIIRVIRSLSTREPNPARSIARALGISANRYAYTPHGGNLPQTLVNTSALEIQRGDADLIILTGGETTRSRRRARNAEQNLAWMSASTQSEGDDKPEIDGEELMMNHEIELGLKIMLPIEIYPMFESAIRYSKQRTVSEHQQAISELWSRFSSVAKSNPHAWLQNEYSAEEIRTPSATNRMIGFPYTKLMNSNNDVDMAAALIMCSAEKAQALGVPRDKWVFPHAGTDCHEHNFVSHRHSFTDTPAIRLGGQRVLQLADTTLDDISFVDLYSCFPSAVQLGADSLGLSLQRQLTITGGLPFAGGPFNNYVMHAIATTMEKVRSQPQEKGFVWANGGYATKHSFGVYGATPPTNGFKHDSPQAQVDALPKREVTPTAEAAGPATIEAYSVMHDRSGKPETIRAAVLLANGSRAWCVSNDTNLGAEMCTTEWVGKPVAVDAEGQLRA
jgi:acetyl-CoA C-acetyltransferase